MITRYRSFQIVSDYVCPEFFSLIGGSVASLPRDHLDQDIQFSRPDSSSLEDRDVLQSRGSIDAYLSDASSYKH